MNLRSSAAQTGLALSLALLSGCAAGCGAKSGGGSPVEVASGIDHREWTRLLRAYVNEKGLVDYARWKGNAADRQALRDYLAQFAPAADVPATGAEKGSSLVNGYNALAIAWILDRYPTESIQSLPDSFSAARHTVGRRRVSLDEIEHATLRPEAGFLVHAALVCAARSCPPLAREAYERDRFVAQLSLAMLRWMRREDLNRFEPAERRARISRLFEWYASDFEKEKGGLRGVLSLYAPDPVRAFVADPSTRIEYLPYDWGLNDQGMHGWRYGGSKLFWDRLRARFGS